MGKANNKSARAPLGILAVLLSLFLLILPLQLAGEAAPNSSSSSLGTSHDNCGCQYCWQTCAAGIPCRPHQCLGNCRCGELVSESVSESQSEPESESESESQALSESESESESESQSSSEPGSESVPESSVSEQELPPPTFGGQVSKSSGGTTTADRNSVAPPPAPPPPEPPPEVSVLPATATQESASSDSYTSLEGRVALPVMPTPGPIPPILTPPPASSPTIIVGEALALPEETTSVFVDTVGVPVAFSPSEIENSTVAVAALPPSPSPLRRIALTASPALLAGAAALFRRLKWLYDLKQMGNL